MSSAHLDNISEQANQHFIDPVTTTTTKPLPANSSIKAVRQNASTSSTITSGIQLDGKEQIHIGKNCRHVQVQPQVVNDGARPSDVPYDVLLNDQSVCCFTCPKTNRAAHR